MLAQNEIFLFSEADRQLFDSRRVTERQLLTPEVIDYEMQTGKSTRTLRLIRPTQEGLEHFAARYGSGIRTLVLEDCALLTDLSPLSHLTSLEHISIDGCRADSLWDMSGSRSLRLISLSSSKALTRNPELLRTAPAVEEIRLWGGSFENRYTLDSLECFRCLKTLQRIDLNDIILTDRSMDVLDTLPALYEFNFGAGMLTTEEIAFLCVKYPHLTGESMGAYTLHEIPCPGDVRICGQRKPSLTLPKDRKRLDKYIADFNALVCEYRAGLLPHPTERTD